jgi:hypothetical protein
VPLSKSFLRLSSTTGALSITVISSAIKSLILSVFWLLDNPTTSDCRPPGCRKTAKRVKLWANGDLP